MIKKFFIFLGLLLTLAILTMGSSKAVQASYCGCSDGSMNEYGELIDPWRVNQGVDWWTCVTATPSCSNWTNSTDCYFKSCQSWPGSCCNWYESTAGSSCYNWRTCSTTCGTGTQTQHCWNNGAGGNFYNTRSCQINDPAVIKHCNTFSGNTALNTGVVAYWKLDDGSNEQTGITAIDSSGNNFNGTATGTVVTSSSKNGLARNFSGSDYITAPLPYAQNQNFTYSAWVYWRGTSQAANFFYSGNGGANGYGLFISNGSCAAGNYLTILAGGISCNITSSNYTLPQNQWVFVAFTRDTTTTRLYVNGSQISTGTITPNVPTGNTYIGGGGFNGLIDEVGIWNRALSATEISNLYNNNAGNSFNPVSWGSCSVSCGTGTQTRTCTNQCGNPITQTQACSGPPIVCSNNSQCPNSCYTCINAGTCSASCINNPVNGVCSAWSPWSCAGNSKTRSRIYNPPTCGGTDVSCSPLIETISCNDGNSCTTDTCSAGACINTNLPVTCSTNTDCNDNNTCTTDVCNSPGTCASSCSHNPLPNIDCTTLGCHTADLSVCNGVGDLKVCSHNELTYKQTCPTTCGYAGATIPFANGSCQDLVCPPVNPPTSQACPTYCNYGGGSVPNGACGGTSTCLSVTPIPAQTCPQSCGYSGGTVSNGSCGIFKFQKDTTGTLSNNLVSFWKLNETSGVVAYDTKGYNNGLFGGTTSVAGILSNARSFNGSEKIYFPKTSSLTFTNALTVSAWVNPANCAHGTSGHNSIVTQENGFLLAFNNSCQVANHIYTGGAWHGPDGNAKTLSPNTWSHVVMTWDGTTMKTFVNGLPVGSGTLATGTWGSPTYTFYYMGMRPDCCTQTLNGKIDEVGIWNRALSSTEISNLYNSGAANLLNSAGNTTCLAVTPIPEQNCPTVCHTGTVYVSDGTCYGSKACPPNPPAYQACPDFCGYEGGEVDDGNCGKISCPKKCCPTTPVCNPASSCDTSTSCAGTQLYNCTDGCATYNEYRSCSVGSAGIIQTNSSSINTGSGKISQNGVAPGFNLTGYAARTNILNNINYSTFLCLILKNTGLACQSPIISKQLDDLFTTYGSMYPVTTNPPIAIGTNLFRFWKVSSSDFNTVLGNVISRGETNTIHILIPSPATSSKSQVISTSKTIPANYKIIAFVNGKLDINANVATTHTDPVSSIVFILNNLNDGINLGNLTVAGTVSQLDGVYVFPGSFNDNTGSQLTGYGSLVNTGNGPINFRRSFLSGPAEQWYYEPKYLKIYSTILAAPTYKWSELTPQ